jgi:hypothetical protein
LFFFFLGVTFWLWWLSNPEKRIRIEGKLVALCVCIMLISKKLLNVNVMPEGSTTMFSIHGVKLCSEGLKEGSRRTFFLIVLFFLKKKDCCLISNFLEDLSPLLEKLVVSTLSMAISM